MVARFFLASAITNANHNEAVKNRGAWVRQRTEPGAALQYLCRVIRAALGALQPYRQDDSAMDMFTSLIDNGSAATTRTSVCPQCQGVLQPAWRRPVDHFLGVFVALRRYQCSAPRCQWEGNFLTHD
ncbi:MAG: hypothetical protein AUK52_09045 [Comamonadaceae bacterium CG2_30_60_41]|nr:MAG: hypothetical protein AUK52_09045 [Comamonadaceae bacterium CG2_30_60_41]PIW09545.1 MAG: hypothetical protein COW39_04290 [Comamonadaceae bacterium CG17_big_fil_post_rev_8_21_14_2_50_60_13]